MTTLGELGELEFIIKSTVTKKIYEDINISLDTNSEIDDNITAPTYLLEMDHIKVTCNLPKQTIVEAFTGNPLVSRLLTAVMTGFPDGSYRVEATCKITFKKYGDGYVSILSVLDKRVFPALRIVN